MGAEVAVRHAPKRRRRPAKRVARLEDHSITEDSKESKQDLVPRKDRVTQLQNELRNFADEKERLEAYKKLADTYAEENGKLEEKIVQLQQFEKTSKLAPPPRKINPQPVVQPRSKPEIAPDVSGAKAQEDSAFDFDLESLNLPPRLAAAVQRYRALHEVEEFSIRDVKKNVRNVWFQRILLLGAGEIVGILLFTYSFIFMGTFLKFQNTTSYFPWAWGLNYVQSGIVWSQFNLGVGISIAALVGCMATQFYIFEIKLKPCPHF